jgi:alpha-galactosidase/6-phospho-beta-glucosidase family protein
MDDQKKKEELRNELRKKLKSKLNTLNMPRMSKEMKEKAQINSLKENPMFQNVGNIGNIGNIDNKDMNNIINTMVNQMGADPKQKKNIKKQMENLVDKMKTI